MSVGGSCRFWSRRAIESDVWRGGRNSSGHAYKRIPRLSRATFSIWIRYAMPLRGSTQLITWFIPWG